MAALRKPIMADDKLNIYQWTPVKKNENNKTKHNN